MDQSRDKRIMFLVRACADMPSDERAEYLAAQCSGDHELIAQVEVIVADDGSETGINPSTERLARALPGHYRLLALIGSGGMAEVFLAEDTRLHRKVAIKFLNDAFRSDPERMLRFKQEARSASALNHPNIITIHDIGESDGVQYIVSEYIDGETLASRMTRGRLSLSQAIDIAIQIASALEASHRTGIVHRDLKPENIMLRRDGGLKVVDFGLAKGSAIFGHRGESIEIVTTSPGMILGTPRYMSPEQARGLPLDGRSDIFSFGIIMFEMVTGRTPFPGTTAADRIAAILGKEPRPITSFVTDPPQKLVDIIDRSLLKDPEERYRSMEAVLLDLVDLKADLTVPVPTVSERTESPRFGLPRLLTAGVAVLMLVMASVWAWWYIGSRGPGPSAPTGALRNVQITSWSSNSPEAGAAASFSPDARMVAFASTKSGASEIWSKPTTGGEPIQVTRNGFYNQYPIWSPDGQELAFYSSRGSEHGIWRVSFTGGQETRVTTGSPSARPIRWTKDGRLFVSDGNEINQVDPSSGEKNQLTNFNSSGVNPRAFAVSSDGAFFAISINEPNGWKVKTGKFGSDTLSDLAVSKDQIDDLVFDQSNTTVYYTGRMDGTQQIFRSGTTADTPVQISSGNSDCSLQDVSSDGSKVLYSSIAETSDLWLINTNDGEASVFANDVDLEYWPEASPDGKNIAYELVQQADRPSHGAVMIKAAKGDTPVTLTTDGSSPSWSPDGAWISFFRRSDSGISIWKVRPTGSDATQIAQGASPPSYSNPPYLKFGLDAISWSPDSSQIVYAAPHGSGTVLMLASADGSGDRELLTSDDSNEKLCCAKWSADAGTVVASSETRDPQGKGRVYRIWAASIDGSNKKIIYEAHSALRCLGFTPRFEIAFAQRSDPADTSSTPASASIWVIPLAGGTARKIGEIANAYFNNIRPSQDGSVIAYVTRTKENTQLFTLNTAGGPPKPVFTENDPKILLSSLAWSHDGKTIILGKQTRTNVLSMLTN